MRFKNSPQLPGAGRTRAWHHHGSDTPTSPGAFLLHSSLLGYIKSRHTLYHLSIKVHQDLGSLESASIKIFPFKPKIT